MYRFVFGIVTLVILLGAIFGIRILLSLIASAPASGFLTLLEFVPTLLNSLIAVWLIKRIISAWRSGEPLLLPDFVNEKRIGYGFGRVLPR